MDSLARGLSVLCRSWNSASGQTLLRLSVVATAAFTLVSSPIRAQADDSAGLEEIIVTAQKREQSLIEVPLSVQAISNDHLENFQIKGVADLVTSSPSLAVVQTTNPSVFNLVIRGQGPAAQERGVEQSVGVFIDGIYRSRPAMAIQDLSSVERIEVLKGPQSTVFGRNNSAGAVSIVTQKPLYEFGGTFELGYGNYDTTVAKGTVTGPIIQDMIAFRLSGNVRQRDAGTIKNSIGKDTGQIARDSVRGELLFDFNDSTSLRVVGDYSSIDDKCCSSVPLFISDADAAAYVTFGATIPGYEDGRPATVNGVAGRRLDPFDRDIAQGDQSLEKVIDRGGSAQLDHDFGPVSLTVVGAARYTRSIVNYEVDSIDTPIPVFPFSGIISLPTSIFKEQQAEVRLTSTSGGMVEWIAGAYWFHQKLMDRNFIPAFGLDSMAHQETDSYAAFGQTAVHLTERLTTTIGLRYNTEQKHVHYGGVDPIAPLLQLPASLHVEDDSLMGDFAISYAIADNANVYARYGRGYKSPGANMLPFGPLSATDSLGFDAEKTDAYEIGAKLRVNQVSTLTLAAFQQKTKNQQVQIQDSTNLTLSVQNAARAKAQGVEAEYSWKPIERLDLGGGLTYLDSKWLDYANASPAVIGGGGPQDISGERTLQSPKWAISSYFQYRLPVGQGKFDLVPRAGLSYRTSYFTTTSNDDVLENDSTVLVNASLEIAERIHNLSLQFWGKNLTNEKLIASGGAFPVFIGSSVYAYVNEPRTWGLTLRGQF